MAFKEPLHITKVRQTFAPDDEVYVVLSPFTWYTRNFSVTVPRGFMTDGASVPKKLKCILPAWGTYGQAAVLHDFLCEYLVVREGERLRSIKRSKADAIFCDAMRFLGVDSITRELMHEAVETYTKFMKEPNVPSTTHAKRVAESTWAQENPINGLPYT